ncbi:hypothetical protein FRC20_011525 [Serendipita sp. 405]|nr:hypothetical protein FRC18_004160 [Serendipita sp. 400]KAG8870647.1 hypothetical protein FRC20_011525 [Serendipita sp. 405]
MRDHLATFRMFSKLESISLPDMSRLGLRQLLEGIEQEILTKGGPILRSVVIGDLICEVDVNGRLKRSRRIIRSRPRRGGRTIVEYVGEEGEMIRKRNEEID